MGLTSSTRGRLLLAYGPVASGSSATPVWRACSSTVVQGAWDQTGVSSTTCQPPSPSRRPVPGSPRATAEGDKTRSRWVVTVRLTVGAGAIHLPGGGGEWEVEMLSTGRC